MIDERIAYHLEANGPIVRGEAATAEQLDRMSSCLPQSLVAIVAEYGFASLCDGAFRFCDPATMRSILALVFKGDPELQHTNCHVVAHTAFGVLKCWSIAHGPITVDLPSAMVFSAALAPTEFKDLPDAPVAEVNDPRFANLTLPLQPDDADYDDANAEPLYHRCTAAHGQVGPDDCYGFFPALALAGPFSQSRRLENIRRVKAREHYAFLAQVETFALTRIGPSGFEAVRMLG